MKKLLLLPLLLFASWLATAQDFRDYYKEPAEKMCYMSKTRKDWSAMAKIITLGCSTDYQRIHAIYTWITRHIAYDPAYKVVTGDECFKRKKGICQAYCELFYNLAEAAGVRTEMVRGDARAEEHGSHAWIFAYTRENYGILLDPTWGAGSLKGKTFKFRKDHDAWFNVDPKWMILTHFPDDPAYQLMDTPLPKEDYDAMTFPDACRQASDYGIDQIEIYQHVRDNTVSLPIFYTGGEGTVELEELPLQETLHIGIPYTFRVTALKPCELVLVHNDKWYKSAAGAWTDEGMGLWSIEFIPEAEGDLIFGIRAGSSKSLCCVVEYKVAEPPQDDEWVDIDTIIAQ